MTLSTRLPRLTLAVLASATAAALGTIAPASATSPSTDETRKVLLSSAREDVAADTASLPLRAGRLTDGRTFSFVVTESSDRDDALRRGVNWAPKLANTRGTTAVQSGRMVAGTLVVDHGVNFSPERVVVPGPGGFPPAVAEPGAVGEPGYSPLVQLPNGVVINASHVLNSTGSADKLLSQSGGRAVFSETEGFYDGKEVYYVSFDASDPGIAALENVTYAPALNAAPGLGSNARSSARSGIAPFVNGQTGVDNPNRQGLNSALLGEGSPLNVVQTLAGDRDYSPLWDVHATMWTDTAKAAGADLRQDDFDKIEKLAERGTVTGPGGASWGAIGAIVNCPLISVED